MIQNIIVILIGIIVVVYLLHKLFKCLFDKSARNNKCANCPGCILKPKKETDNSKKDNKKKN